MTEGLERTVHRMRLSVIPHADGDLVSVVRELGGWLSIETMPADQAPAPPAPDACLGCGGAGELVVWEHGEPEPRSTDTCPSCGGSGKLP